MKKESTQTGKEKMKREIGLRIMSLRIDNCYSRKELSKKLGISSGFLYEIELGKKGFSAFTLLKMAEVLNVSTDYIMTGSVRDITGSKEAENASLPLPSDFSPRRAGLSLH